MKVFAFLRLGWLVALLLSVAGGELAALTLIEACVRLLPGVLGNAAAVTVESFEDGLLEYPHYTKPQIWAGRAVPEILLSGHHEKIRAWRLNEAERLTRQRRPDMWQRYQSQSSPYQPQFTTKENAS